MKSLAFSIVLLAGSTYALTKYAGVNIAGFDFGCFTEGSCDLSQTVMPVAALGGPDGIGQMQHFVKDDHLNAFRLPVGWQYFMNNPGDTFISSKISNYDQLVQGCLKTGALCIIDVHNYARWNSAIIGQGGPSNAQFANLWAQFARKYANQPKIAFGIMNEPHDIPNISTWASTVQAAVTAIRNAGATKQLILLPGNDYTSAQAFVSDGSGAALLKVKNPDGTTNNLVFDVHKYLDSDGSGQHAECVTNAIDSSFSPLAAWLRSVGRTAFLSEIGGGNTNSCATYLCQALNYLKYSASYSPPLSLLCANQVVPICSQNSDVFLGYTTWSAGGFYASWNYVLTEVPTKNNNGVWTDTSLVKACIAR